MSLERSPKDKIFYEATQINKEFEIIDLLTMKLLSTNLDPIELRAAATSMQSVYNGFEKILVTILISRNSNILQTQSWHSELLLLCKDEKII